MNKLKFIFIWVGVVLLSACTHTTVYCEYCKLPDTAWHQDSLCVFDATVDDTINHYNILLNIRHNSSYAYQNFWTFVHSTSPEGISQTDTIECFLADLKGNWLGTGYFSVYEMPVLYMEHIRFPRKGTYHFEVAHGMRDSLLIGITDIGISIEQSNNGKE